MCAVIARKCCGGSNALRGSAATSSAYMPLQQSGDADVSSVADEQPINDAVVPRALSLRSSSLLPPSVSDVSMSIRRGELVAIVGAVGAGKSTLLSGLLGEAISTQSTASVQLGNRVVYCPQSPWIRSATIRDNILFGVPLMESRYRAVLAACALEPDLALFPTGDQTEVGERGVTLSGGQKQRISLARALYAVLAKDQHALCLLDDPLSAVGECSAFSYLY